MLSKNINKKYEHGIIDIHNTVACVLKWIVNTALSAMSRMTDAIKPNNILIDEIEVSLLDVLSAIIAPKAIYGKA